jgi:putative acetyltransferase
MARDRDGIDAVVGAAFGDEHGATVVELVRALDASGVTRASIVAVEGDEIVGHVQLSRGWIDARKALVEALTLSPLSVAPARQRSGIGSQLIGAALVYGERLGAPAVFLEGDWRYYGNRGFADAETLGFLRPSERIPGPGFQVALLEAFEDWMVGRHIYAEAFWALGCVGMRDPELAEFEHMIRDDL